MAFIDPKRKMVSFRLSATEYNEAENACRAKGYRSLSLFARSALLNFVSGNTAPESFGSASTTQELNERVDQLAAELKRLAGYIETSVQASRAGEDSTGQAEAANFQTTGA